MAHKRIKSLKKDKISSEFSAKLNNFGTNEKVRAIVLLYSENIKKSNGKRLSNDERQSIMESMRISSEQALSDIDKILKNFAGQRLSENISVLGSLPVETTPEGIKALAESKWVKSILEDQKIYPIHK
jgi:DNA-binding Lrp family transcriptional regulator